MVPIGTNAPLAGVPLHLEGEVIDVRNAMPEAVTLVQTSEQDNASKRVVVTMRSQKEAE